MFGWEGIATMFSQWVHKQDLTALKAAYDGSASVNDDNGYAIYLAVGCTDAAWPQPVSRVLADNVRVARTAPFETWGNAWFNGPCSFWKAPGRTPVPITGRGAPPILMVNETLDAATPYAGALEARRIFPGSVLIEGVGGTTHAGSLSGVACTDNTIADYLTSGALPKRVAGNRSDKRCEPVPQPAPTGWPRPWRPRRARHRPRRSAAPSDGPPHGATEPQSTQSRLRGDEGGEPVEHPVDVAEEPHAVRVGVLGEASPVAGGRRGSSRGPRRVKGSRGGSSSTGASTRGAGRARPLP